MKKIIAITTLSLLITAGLFAQRSGNSGRQRVQKEVTVQERVDKMSSALNLTDKQKTELTDFFSKTDAERKKSVEETRATQRAEAEKRRITHNAELKRILGEEKYAQWQENNSNNRRVAPMNRRNAVSGSNRSANAVRSSESGARAASQRGNRVAMTPQEQADRLAKNLNLNDTQKTRLVEHFTEIQATRETNRNNAELSRGERRTQAGIRIQENEAKLKEILGEKKFNELQEWRTANRTRSVRR